jgi:hypothetical protein
MGLRATLRKASAHAASRSITYVIVIPAFHFSEFADLRLVDIRL